MLSGAIPKASTYVQGALPVGLDSRRRTIRLIPQSGSSNYNDVSSNVIRIDLPPSIGFLDTQNSYLKFRISVKSSEVDLTVPCRMDENAMSWVQRLEIISNNGSVLESIDNYNLLVNLLHSATSPDDYRNTAGKLLDNVGSKAERNAAMAMESGKEFCCGFDASGILGANSKYLPCQFIQGSLTLVLQLAPFAECFVGQPKTGSQNSKSVKGVYTVIRDKDKYRNEYCESLSTYKSGNLEEFQYDLGGRLFPEYKLRLDGARMGNAYANNLSSFNHFRDHGGGSAINPSNFTASQNEKVHKPESATGSSYTANPTKRMYGKIANGVQFFYQNDNEALTTNQVAFGTIFQPDDLDDLASFKIGERYKVTFKKDFSNTTAADGRSLVAVAANQGIADPQAGSAISSTDATEATKTNADYLYVVGTGDIRLPAIETNAGDDGFVQSGVANITGCVFFCTKANVASARVNQYSGPGTTVQLKGLSAPSLGSDAVTKTYVDDIRTALEASVNGLSWKDTAVAGTTSALPVAVYTATALEASSNGSLPAQDGVTLSVGDRFLVKDQTDGAQNGIYSVTSVGGASAKWKLTRTSDADSNTELRSTTRQSGIKTNA